MSKIERALLYVAVLASAVAGGLNIILLTEAKLAQQRHDELMRRTDALREVFHLHESELGAHGRVVPHTHIEHGHVVSDE